MGIEFKRDLITKPSAWPFEMEDMTGKSGNLNAGAFWTSTETVVGTPSSYSTTQTYSTDQTVDPNTNIQAQCTCNFVGQSGESVTREATTVNEIPAGSNFYFWTSVRESVGSASGMSGSIILVGATNTSVHTSQITVGDGDTNWQKGFCIGIWNGSGWTVYGPNVAGASVSGDATTGGLKVRVNAYGAHGGGSNNGGTSYAGVGNIWYGG